MALKDSPLHDHPRSPKGQQQAKKGDTDIVDGEEMESIGSIGEPEGSPEKIDEKDWPDWRIGRERKDKRGIEMWRPKKKSKPEIPTS